MDDAPRPVTASLQSDPLGGRVIAGVSEAAQCEIYIIMKGAVYVADSSKC